MPSLPLGYEIRWAKAGDIAALISADRAASELFRPTGLVPDMAAIPESIPAETLAAAIEDKLVIAAATADRAVGFALCELRGDDLYLDQLSVDPSHGRKGLGAALLDAVAALAERRERRSVILSTFRDLPWNGPFYRRHGYKELPRKQMTDWMRDVEAVQAETLDVSLRCFMRRPIKSSRGLLRAKRG